MLCAVWGIVRIFVCIVDYGGCCMAHMGWLGMWLWVGCVVVGIW